MEVIVKQLAIIINLLERICYKMGIEVNVAEDEKRKEELMGTKIELGAIVTDTVTGFTGIAIARAEYIYGSTRVEVQPVKLTGDGDLVNAKWIEEDRLKVG